MEVPTIGAEALEINAEIPGWAEEIVRYLEASKLPKDKGEERKVRNRAIWFTLVNVVLYKRGYSNPFLRCVSQEEALYILIEVHEGVCGNHFGERSLAVKVMRVGYY
ncbi:hypothetical protein F2P56_035224 [Juglans regia]|uniref:Integrase zinc-binding domain-containing protein n=2 Tax=Juglans regia TaxID=51240 RepID=A0A833WS64_JUGRE|nr:uncharacterized protein LOC109004335 [Juglans regia]KAF5442582.1 hypothetical protein F2P56_035224 [Juglans regia]